MSVDSIEVESLTAGETPPREARVEVPPAEVAAGVRREPGLSVFVGVGILTFVLTALEILAATSGALAGVARPLIVVLMAANFLLAALYYQGLAGDAAAHKVIFGAGIGLGLIFGISLPVFLLLGLFR